MVYQSNFNYSWSRNRFILQTWTIRIFQSSQHLHDCKILQLPSHLFFCTKKLSLYRFYASSPTNKFQLNNTY